MKWNKCSEKEIPDDKSLLFVIGGEWYQGYKQPHSVKVLAIEGPVNIQLCLVSHWAEIELPGGQLLPPKGGNL